jgi:hypothetical protein
MKTKESPIGTGYFFRRFQEACCVCGKPAVCCWDRRDPNSDQWYGREWLCEECDTNMMLEAAGEDEHWKSHPMHQITLDLEE